MVERFGDYLIQFARSIDLVREDDFTEILRTAKEYSLKAFKLEYFELYTYNIHEVDRGSSRDKEERLNSWRFEDSNRQQWDRELIDPQTKKPNGQISYAFIKNLPLWIVDEVKNPLHSDNSDDSPRRYKDCWSNSASKNIPKYQKHSSNDSNIYTFICIPLSVKVKDNSGNLIGEQKSGVLTFEISQHYDLKKHMEEAQKEMKNIADAIAITNHLRCSRILQYKNTDVARKTLAARLNKCLPTLSTYPLLEKPKLFFGFPQEGSEEVISVTKMILEERETVNVYDWQKDNSSRNIHQSILEEIRESRYGVFYLSKIKNSPSTSQTPQSNYVDNPNVLIEIGMMLSMQSETNLIIIREKNSPDIPFDLVAQKRIEVVRDNSGNLQEENFKYELKGSLDSLLKNL